VKNVFTKKLDGTFVKSSENKTLNDIATTEQIIRDHFAADKPAKLIRFEQLSINQRKIILAHVMGFRHTNYS
jgi:hypothetical protein